MVHRMKGKLIFRRPAPRVQVAIDAAVASNGCGVWRLVWYNEGKIPPQVIGIASAADRSTRAKLVGRTGAVRLCAAQLVELLGKAT